MIRPRDHRLPWFELALFGVALAVRLVFLIQLSGTPFIDERELIADAAYYDMRGREIAAGDLLGDAPGFLSPLYCLFVGVAYSTLSATPLAVKLLQAVLGAASCVLLFRVGRGLFALGVGQLAGLGLAVYGPHLYYGGLMLPATLIVFLHLLLLEVASRPRTWRTVSLAGLLVGLAVLAKSNAVLLLPAVAAAWWFSDRDRSPRLRLRHVALFGGLALVAVLPTVATNFAVSGAFPIITTTGGSNLLKGNGPTATGTHTFLPLGTQFTGLRAHLDHEVNPRRAVEQSRQLGARALAYVIDHPGRTLSLHGKKLLLLLNARELGIRDSYAFVRDRIPLLRLPLLQFWIVAPLGLAGVVLAWRDRRRLAVLYAVLAVQAVSFVSIFVLARYRLVAVVCLLPFAAALLSDLANSWRSRSTAGLVPALALVAAFAVVVAMPFSEFPRDRGFADQHAFLADHAAARVDDATAVVHYRAALESSWQDERRADLSRFRATLGLARAEAHVGQSAMARERLERLLGELQRAGAATLEAECRAQLDPLIPDSVD